ncbi:hypothetical protein FRC00_002846 [Tulasnella sp. 408]|nr:hypothetical protein FRC00_002846 [Tulasnella sp. 408]
MFFLPICSIPHFMVNKKLRPVCEQYLYRFIRLVCHPYRSLRLLNTLAHRPDLALLIRDLHINLDRCHPKNLASSKLPEILQPDGLAPLSSARNIRSLHIGGLNWLSDRSVANIRRIVSNMELTSLVITDPRRSRPDDDEEVNQRVSNLRAILQSQPQLEFLYLTLHAFEASEISAIEVADVPNLRRFKGNPQYVGPILNIAPKLSKLHLDFDFGGLSYKSLGEEEWNGHRIQDLAISMNLKRVSNWDHFERLLARFPNTESLYLRSSDLVYSSILWYYLENLPPRLRALPLLRKLETRNIDVTNTEDLDETVEVLLKFKQHCPVLEHFIDANNRQWVYVPSANEGSGFSAKLDCQLESNSFFHRFDVLPLERDA